MRTIKKTLQGICKYVDVKKLRGSENPAVYCKCHRGNDAPDFKMFEDMDKKGMICVSSYIYKPILSKNLNSFLYVWKMPRCPYRNL